MILKPKRRTTPARGSYDSTNRSQPPFEIVSAAGRDVPRSVC
jgi:hypothetical protein